MITRSKLDSGVPTWVNVWLIVSGVICALDVFFTMTRPLCTTGPLKDLFYGWNLYASVDKRYAETTDVVTMATGRIMIIEILMNFLAVYLSYRKSRHALLMAFTTTAFVLWKTVWFLLLYIRPPGGEENEYFLPNNPWWKILLVFWVPNGFWVVVPFIVMCALWNRLALPIAEREYERCSNSLDRSDC